MKTTWYHSGKYLALLFVWVITVSFRATACPPCRWSGTYVAEADLIVTAKIIAVETGQPATPFDTVVLQVQKIVKGKWDAPQLKAVTLPEWSNVGSECDYFLARYQGDIYFALPFLFYKEAAGYKMALERHQSYEKWGEEYQTWKIWIRREQARETNAAGDLLSKLAGDKDVFVRGEVAANPATPPKILSALAQDEDWWIRYKLARNDHAPIPVLVHLAMNRGTFDTEYIALNTLETLEEQQHTVGPAIMNGLVQSDKRVRQELLALFNRLAPQLKSVSPAALLPQLMELWEQETDGGRRDVKTWADIEYRQSIIEALGNLGPEAASAETWLMKLTEDSIIQRPAVVALGKIRAYAAVPLMATIIQRPIESTVAKSDDGQDREATQQQLERVEEQLRLREDAISALGNIGAPAASVLPILLRLLAENELATDTHAVILTAISQIDPQDPGVAPALMAALRTRGWKNSTARRAAITAWGRLSCNATAVADLLQKFREESDEEIQYDMVTALGNIGSQADGVQATIIQAAGPGNKRRVRHAALTSLSKLSPPAPEAVAVLIAALQNQDLRLTACNTLRKLGAAAKESLPALRTLLQHEDFTVQAAAQAAITAIEK